MWLESSVMREDLEQICSADFIPWEQLRNKTILVTGATGLIGTSLVSALLYAGRKRELGLTVLALVRDANKAEQAFAQQMQECPALKIVKGDVEDRLAIDENIDYIVHGASPTSSAFFVQHPAQTMQAILLGGMNVLELARRHESSGVLFLSTMEVYGHPPKGHRVTEQDVGAFLPTEARSSYPIAKLACENLFCSYSQEYGVPAKVLRLAQTFGAGVDYDDKRVFAEFARCALEKRTIILKTKGETERSYLYTADAVTAILTTMLKGEPGQVCTAANEKSYCSIREMAELVAGMYQIGVTVEEQDIADLGYADTLYMDLDVGKLKQLGWAAKTGLPDMYRRMIAEMDRKI